MLLLKEQQALSRMQQAVGDGGRAVPSLRASQSRLMADSFCVHRIIEDPEWCLIAVPPLTELCLQHIVQNFTSKRGEECWVLGERRGSEAGGGSWKARCGTQPCQRSRWGKLSPQAAS